MNIDPVYVSIGFLGFNVIALVLVLILNRAQGNGSAVGDGFPINETHPDQDMDASQILTQEFEYARITASEAMNDRHTMVNFYLVVVGIVSTGTAAILGLDADIPTAAGTALLWILCGIGWFYFLNIIRLRQAWFASARAMNQIKIFYIHNSKQFPQRELVQAFFFTNSTIPQPDKPWTAYFYSAALIGFVDSIAFGIGSVLLYDITAIPAFAAVFIGALGLIFFAFYVSIYFAFLRQ